MVIALYTNRLCNINSLENFNLLVLLKPFLVLLKPFLVLLKPFLENSIYMQQIRIKIKSQTSTKVIFHSRLLLKLLQCIFGNTLRRTD